MGINGTLDVSRDNYRIALSQFSAKTFLGLFSCLLLVFYLIESNQSDSILVSVINSTCYITALLAETLGLTASWIDGYVSIEGFMLEINLEFTTMHLLFIYLSGVLAYPAHGLSYKIKGAIFGLSFLVLVNILRIIIHGVVGSNTEREVFDFIHIYVWQTLYILTVFSTWCVWVAKVQFKSILKLLFILLIASFASFLTIELLMNQYINPDCSSSDRNFTAESAMLFVICCLACIFQHHVLYACTRAAGSCRER